MKWLLLVCLIVIGVLVLVACSGSKATTPATSSTTTSVATTTPGQLHFAQLADAGKRVFAASCAGCHGNNGQGATAPALIGSSAQLGKYGTALGLLNFIDTNMPLSGPATLSHGDYVDVLAYLLLQNNYVTQTTLYINEGQLGAITLK